MTSRYVDLNNPQISNNMTKCKRYEHKYHTAIKLPVLPHGQTATVSTFAIKKGGDFIQLTTKDVAAAISDCHNRPRKTITRPGNKLMSPKAT